MIKLTRIHSGYVFKKGNKLISVLATPDDCDNYPIFEVITTYRYRGPIDMYVEVGRKHGSTQFTNRMALRYSEVLRLFQHYNNPNIAGDVDIYEEVKLCEKVTST